MDISFYTTAGAENKWSLGECATWVREHVGHRSGNGQFYGM